MKYLIRILQLIIITNSSFALGSEADCTITRETPCVINSKTSVRTIDVHYPQMMSCNLKLITTKDLVLVNELKKLAEGLRVTLQDSSTGQTLELEPVISRNKISYKLGDNTLFLAQVTVQTRNRESLDSLIQATLATKAKPNIVLIAIPVACEQHD